MQRLENEIFWESDLAVKISLPINPVNLISRSSQQPKNHQQITKNKQELLVLQYRTQLHAYNLIKNANQA